MKLSGVALAAVVTLYGVSGCGLKSKITQCNAFIEKANHSQTVVSGLHLDSEDPVKLESEATAIEAEAKAVEGVELKDEKLVKLRTDYSGMLTKLAKLTRDLAALQKSAGKGDHSAVTAKAATIKTDAAKIEADESKLVTDINGYCSGGS